MNLSVEPDNAKNKDENKDIALKKLLWRCRRGMLEMDLLLAQFVPLHFDQLSATQKEAFNALLNYPDNELWTAIANAEQTNNEMTSKTLPIEITSEIKHVLSLLRSCCAQSMQ